MSLGICLSGQCFCVRSKGFWKWCLCRKGKSWDTFSLGILQCREAELRMLIVFFPNSSPFVTIKVTQPSYKYENHINRLSYWVGKRIKSPNDLILTHFYNIILWKILEFTYSTCLQFQVKKVSFFSFCIFFSPLYLINEFYLIRKSFKMLGLLSWRIKSSIYRQGTCSSGTRGVNPLWLLSMLCALLGSSTSREDCSDTLAMTWLLRRASRKGERAFMSPRNIFSLF